MKKKKRIFGIPLLLLVFGLFLTGCGTVQPAPQPFQPFAEITETVDVQAAGIERITAWAHLTEIPYKDFVVVGAISLRNVNEATLLADLMDRAIEMGGHDIINVRVGRVMETVIIETDERTERQTQRRISNATAVVIQYTDVTWVPPVLSLVEQQAMLEHHLMQDVVVVDVPVGVTGAPAAPPPRRRGLFSRILGTAATAAVIGVMYL